MPDPTLNIFYMWSNQSSVILHNQAIYKVLSIDHIRITKIIDHFDNILANFRAIDDNHKLFPINGEHNTNIKEEFFYQIKNDNEIDNFCSSIEPEYNLPIILKLWVGCIEAAKATRFEYIDRSGVKPYSKTDREKDFIQIHKRSNADKVYDLGVKCAPLLELILRNKDKIYLNGISISSPIWTHIKHKNLTFCTKYELVY